MTIRNPQTIEISVDDVLRGQGAIPELIRKRNPRFVAVAEEAIELGLPALVPQVLYQWRDVKAIRHESVILEDNHKLTGPLIAQHLKGASKVAFILVTVGTEIDALVHELMQTNPVLAIALDGVGSAAAEHVANAICADFEEEAALNGMQASIPLSPGMINWDVHEGQPEIFKVLDASEIGVSLTVSGLMLPRKSLSMVMGFGEEMSIHGTTCDYCAMKETCKYRDHYEGHHAFN